MIAETKLTARQQEVLDYLKSRHQYVCLATVRDIMRHFGMRSPNAVVGHLKALEKKGHIIRMPHLSHGIHLAEFNGEAVEELKDAARSVLAVCESSNLAERDAHKRLARALEPFGGVGT